MEGVIDKGVVVCAVAHEKHVEVDKGEVVDMQDMQDNGSKNGIKLHVEGEGRRGGDLC